MAKRTSKPTPSDPYYGLLSGSQWNSNTVTYSFPDAAADYGKGYSETKNFKAFSSTEQAAFTTVIKQVSSFTNLQFSLVSGSADGTADIRIAKTVTQGADAWAYYPGAGKGGDAWFDTGVNGSDGGKGGMNWAALKPGDYTYTVLLHEFGHSLGLKHSFENGGVAGAVPKQYDSLEYTVMSYDAYQTSPYSSSVDQRNWWADDGNNPQTFMMLDIAALQKLYGANYATNGSDTVYQWNETTGETSLNGVGQGAPSGGKVFLTIWDGGGNDTYDFGNFSVGVRVDLNAGGWTSIDYANIANPALRADLLAGTGTQWAVGNIANALLYQGNTASLIENAVGGSGDDILVGNQKSNVLTGGAGKDTFVFSSAPASLNVDTITDFVAADDTIWLEDAVFTSFAGQTFTEDCFYVGTSAHDTDDRILYDPTSGYLYYDGDGSQSGMAAVQFAYLSTRPVDVTYADFLLV